MSGMWYEKLLQVLHPSQLNGKNLPLNVSILIIALKEKKEKNKNKRKKGFSYVYFNILKIKNKGVIIFFSK